MTDNAKKTSELAVATSAAGTDRVIVLTSPSSSPVTKSITVSNLFGNSSANVEIYNIVTIANSSITVSKGTIMFDTSYLYIAVADNTLKRITLESF
jgi:hypothetical protein